jgi:hypothetical protein
MAALIALIFVALTLGLGFAFAAPWLVIIPIAVVVLFVAWLLVVAASGRTPQRAVRQTRKAELLGPGGPDDPTS